VAISADGEYIAAGSGDDKVYLFRNILPPNQSPTASITSITPNTVILGEMIEGTDVVAFHEDWENGQGNWIFTNTYGTPVEVSSNYPFSGEYTLSVGDTPCNSGCQGYLGDATLIFEAPFPESEYALTWWVYENDNQINPGLGYGRTGELVINGEFVFRFDNYNSYDPNPGWVMYKYTHLGDITSIAFRAWDMPEWGLVMAIDNITISSTEYGPRSLHFTGSASDSDGTLAAYEWSSSLDGFLSDQSSFILDSSLLSVGTHTITFRAQDNDGNWSEYATSWLEMLPDTDGDGVEDNSDAFPNNPDEWADSDGDGVGNNEDPFPSNPGEWTDTDSDGVGDNGDDFPSNPWEWTDTDGDGWGDNSDHFPSNPDEWTDTDDDGTGDNSDALPNDPDEQFDTDGDGVGDNSDPFPETALFKSWLGPGLIIFITIMGSVFFLAVRTNKGILAEAEQILEELENKGGDITPTRRLIAEAQKKVWDQSLVYEAKNKAEETFSKHNTVHKKIDVVDKVLKGFDKDGVDVEEALEVLEHARNTLSEGKFIKAREHLENAKEIGSKLKEGYELSMEKIDQIKAKIAEFKEKGVNTDKLEKILKKAEKAAKK